MFTLQQAFNEMVTSNDLDNRFYIDGPCHPQTPHEIATERHYRRAFCNAAEEAARWTEPDRLAISKAWAKRRKARKAAETGVVDGIIVYRVGHEIDAATTRGRVQALEYVRQCYEALTEIGFEKDKIGPLVIKPWLRQIELWAGAETVKDVMVPPPRPDDQLTNNQRRMLVKHISPDDPRPLHSIIRRLNDVTREVLDWLWPGRIPLGKLTLLAGDPGLGKSFVTLDIASRVSRGAAWPDTPLLKETAGGVVLMNSEDDLADTIAPRLDKMQADDSRIIALEGVMGRDEKSGKEWRRSFSLESDLPRLEEVLIDNPDTRLVVIDPISAYTGGVDSHKNADVCGLLAPLAELAGRHHVSVLSVTHLSKSMGSKAVYRAMGSLAFAAASRSVWAIVKDQNDPQRRLFLPAKLNLANEPDGLAYRIKDGRVCWDVDPIRMHADDAFAAELRSGNESRNRGAERREAGDWIREQLAKGSMPSSEIIADAKENGISERTLRRAFKEMGGQSKKDDDKWVWCLPDQELDALNSEKSSTTLSSSR